MMVCYSTTIILYKLLEECITNLFLAGFDEPKSHIVTIGGLCGCVLLIISIVIILITGGRWDYYDLKI